MPKGPRRGPRLHRIPGSVSLFIVALVSFAAGSLWSSYQGWKLLGMLRVPNVVLNVDPRVALSVSDSDSVSGSGSNSNSISDSDSSSQQWQVSLPVPRPPRGVMLSIPGFASSFMAHKAASSSSASSSGSSSDSSSASSSASSSGANSVLIVLQGGIAERLQVLCAADAYMSARGIPVTAVWVPDQSVLQAGFPDLVEMPRGSTVGVQEAWPSDVAPFNLRSFFVKVRLGLNQSSGEAVASSAGAGGEEGEDEAADAAAAAADSTTNAEEGGLVPLPFFAPKDLLPALATGAGGQEKGEVISEDGRLPEAQELSDDEAMELLTSFTDRQSVLRPAGTVAQCFRRMRPSPVVQGMMQEEDPLRFVGSTGVIAERKRLGDECPGCPGRLSSCTIRTIAMRFLRDLDEKILIVSVDPRDAVNVSRTFHPSRAPGLSVTTHMRLKHGCQLMHQLAAAAAAAAGNRGLMDLSSEAGDDQSYEEASTPLAPLCAQLFMADLFLISATRAVIHTVASSPAVNIVLARLPMTYSAIAANTGLKLPDDLLEAEPAQASPKKRKGRNALPAELARLLSRRLLGEAASGEGTYDDPVPDQQRVVLPSLCVCTAEHIPQLADHVHAPNMIIDKELKIVYCSVEKVASTSLKMLIRSMRGLPGITNYFRTHTRGYNGLKYLWPHFKGWSKHPQLEFMGIREMTRRDYLKFVFVRNPYSRVLSAYLDKEVMGDSRNNKERPRGRVEYNRKFFGKTFARKYGRMTSKGLWVPWSQKLSFREFISLASLRATQVAKMDHHLANQTDLCRLDAIKYDFVGHLETLDADVEALLEILTKHTKRNASEHKYVFPQGRKVHNLNADKRLLAYYDPEIVGMVKQLYKPDLNNLLNGVKYDLPPALQTMMKNSKSQEVHW